MEQVHIATNETSRPTNQLGGVDAAKRDMGKISLAQSARLPSREELIEANTELFAGSCAIPVVNRYRYLVGEVPDFTQTEKFEYLDADELALKLSMDLEEFQQLIEDMNVPGEMLHKDEHGNLLLAPGLDVVLVEELEWRKKFDALDEEITIPVISNALQASNMIVSRIIKDSRVIPRSVSRADSFKWHYYPKILTQRVRAEIMIFPPARENRNMNQIVGAVGCGNRWPRSRVNDEVFRDLMWPKDPGRVVEHFEPAFEEMLKAEYDGFPETVAEKLRTVPEIAQELGRDHDWVDSRIVRYLRKSKQQLKSGKLWTHYGEDVFSELKRQSDEQRNVPLLEDGMVSLDELVAPLDTTCETAGQALKRLGVEPIERRSLYNGKILNAYSVDIRLSLAEEIIRERKQRLAEYEAVANELSGRVRLTDEERKKFKIARQQRVIVSKHLERAQTAYEKFLEIAA